MGIDTTVLSKHEALEINRLLRMSAHDPPRLEDMWYLLDRVWRDLDCDNTDFDQQAIQEFYTHPVWILNGLFIEQHSLSMQHRHAIADWILRRNLARVLDYGGGFGTLARLIARRDQGQCIHVYEPYPSKAALVKAEPYPNIEFINSVEASNYDCAIAVDVFEHVPDPLKLLAQVTELVRENGFLIIANHFYPSIECHLPTTFHLRYTFEVFARLMGLRRVGPCEGSHAVIYQNLAEEDKIWAVIRGVETLSRSLFPLLRTAHPLYEAMRRLLI